MRNRRVDVYDVCETGVYRQGKTDVCGKGETELNKTGETDVCRQDETDVCGKGETEVNKHRRD